MTVSLADNPAVSNPRAALTPPQQAALGALSFFRYQVLRGSKWHIGNKRFSISTIDHLVEKNLVRNTGQGLQLTTAGKLVHAKLGEAPHGAA